MTVYVAQEPARFDAGSKTWTRTVDLSGAARFGEIDLLFTASEVHAALITQPTVQRLRRDLRTFNDNDYLLLVGDLVLGAMATAVALEVNRGKAKILRWSRDRKDYDVVQLNLHKAEIGG